MRIDKEKHACPYCGSERSCPHLLLQVDVLDRTAIDGSQKMNLINVGMYYSS